jgi:hypothetical protein
MRRIVLVLGVLVLGWLGRRQLRSAADAQRYLTLLAILQVIASMGTSAPAAKPLNIEQRLNNQIVPALGTLNTSVSAMQPIVTVVAGWPLFLGSMSQQAAPSTFGGPASSSNADLFSWAGNATARFNQVYSIMRSTDLWV